MAQRRPSRARGRAEAQQSRRPNEAQQSKASNLNQKVLSATKVTEKEEEKYICSIKKFSKQYHINGLSDKR